MYKGFKKVSEDEKYAVMQSKQGHEIKIAKAGLSKKLQQELAALPVDGVQYLAKGGMVHKGCQNPNCKSAGQPHPNCRCHGNYAKGGMVQNYCDSGKPHAKGCEYFAEGGMVEGKGATASSPASRPDAGWGKVIIKKNDKFLQYFPDGGQVLSEDEMMSMPASPTDELLAQGPNASVPREMPVDPSQAMYTNDAGTYSNISMPDFGAAATSQYGAPAQQSSALAGAMPDALTNIDIQPNATIPATTQAPQNLMDPQMGTKGLSQVISGYQNEAAEIQKQGQAEAKIQEDRQGLQADFMKKAKENFDGFKSEISQVTKEYIKGEIDPNRFWDSKTDTGKTFTAIGLILGGIGSGMTGKSNPALDFLNKQIENDIEAQRANMSKQGNVLSVLRQQYGDQKDAENMLAAMQLDIINSKLQAAAASARGPIAKAKAQQASGMIQNEIDKRVALVTQNQTINQGMQSGRINSAQAISVKVKDEGERKQIREEVGKFQEAESAKKNIRTALARLAETQTFKGRAKDLLEGEREALQVQILKELKTVFNNFSESDKALALKTEPGFFTSKDGLARKVQIMESILQKGGLTPTLDAYPDIKALVLKEAGVPTAEESARNKKFKPGNR